MCIITEFAEHGSLLDYLQSLDKVVPLDRNKMVSFALDIARGMEHITSNKVYTCFIISRVNN